MKNRSPALALTPLSSPLLPHPPAPKVGELSAEVAWMPVAIPGFVLIILYVESTLDNTGTEVHALRKKMYKLSTA